MIESESIAENLEAWRTDVIAKFIRGLGVERTVFEAAGPEVLGWYVKSCGPEVNLFVDHGQILLLECYCAGIRARPACGTTS